MDWIIVKSLAEAFESYFHMPSSVYFLKNIYLPVMFTNNEGGAFYFEGQVYKFVCFKDLDTAYFHIKAYAPQQGFSWWAFIMFTQNLYMLR